MDYEQKENIEEAMRQLTSTLHEQCLDTGLITAQQWNENIAPKLSTLAMAIENVRITARSYRVSTDL